MEKYYTTISTNPKVLRFSGDTMYVFDGKWVESDYWLEKILISDYIHYEEITEERAYELIGRMVA